MLMEILFGTLNIGEILSQFAFNVNHRGAIYFD